MGVWEEDVFSSFVQISCIFDGTYFSNSFVCVLEIVSPVKCTIKFSCNIIALRIQ